MSAITEKSPSPRKRATVVHVTGEKLPKESFATLKDQWRKTGTTLKLEFARVTVQFGALFDEIRRGYLAQGMKTDDAVNFVFNEFGVRRATFFDAIKAARVAGGLPEKYHGLSVVALSKLDQLVAKTDGKVDEDATTVARVALLDGIVKDQKGNETINSDTVVTRVDRAMKKKETKKEKDARIKRDATRIESRATKARDTVRPILKGGLTAKLDLDGAMVLGAKCAAAVAEFTPLADVESVTVSAIESVLSDARAKAAEKKAAAEKTAAKK